MKAVQERQLSELLAVLQELETAKFANKLKDKVSARSAGTSECNDRMLQI